MARLFKKSGDSPFRNLDDTSPDKRSDHIKYGGSLRLNNYTLGSVNEAFEKNIEGYVAVDAGGDVKIIEKKKWKVSVTPQNVSSGDKWIVNVGDIINLPSNPSDGDYVELAPSGSDWAGLSAVITSLGTASVMTGQQIVTSTDVLNLIYVSASDNWIGLMGAGSVNENPSVNIIEGIDAVSNVTLTSDSSLAVVVGTRTNPATNEVILYTPNCYYAEYDGIRDYTIEVKFDYDGANTLTISNIENIWGVTSSSRIRSGTDAQASPSVYCVKTSNNTIVFDRDDNASEDSVIIINFKAKMSNI